MTDVRKIAAEGWIYGFPLLMNYRTMYAQAIDSGDPRYVGGFGHVRHYSQPFTPANTDVVTPNNDTPYSWGWFDLRAEPYVISVPAVDRYYVLPFHDLDTCYVGYVGARTTGDGPGTYLLAGPGWDGEPPAGITRVLRADTSLVGMLGRTYLGGPDDVDTLREIQKSYDIQPLHTHLGTDAPPDQPEPYWPVWREDVLDSADFFTYLDFLLGFFPVLPQEKGVRDRLASIGLDGSGSFYPSPELRADLEAGIADARARLTEAEKSAGSSTGLFGTRAEHGDDYLTKAVGVDKGLYGLPSEEAFYAGWVTDSDGNRPDASRTNYTIHFPAGQLPPARFFWSATMYRLPDRLLVDNPIDRYSIGDRTPGVVYDEDGGLTLHVQRERLAAGESNWLPAPDGPFSIVIRLYGPAPEVLTGEWHIPQITPAE
ncbi:DUF1254 domain-containing protein [Nonomuraea sp. NPDC050556]|uniref:DUF1254 domain-containing protein n=1 Tax=Nonomuraea sp. NPDC050556 TaxID=3364369 RepID=UPI00378BAE12